MRLLNHVWLEGLMEPSITSKLDKKYGLIQDTWNWGTIKKSPQNKKDQFTMEEKLGPVTYRLKLLKTWKIHPTFHAILLSPYRKTEIHRPNFKQPPPDLIEGEYKYEVEWILKHWKQRKTTAYSSNQRDINPMTTHGNWNGTWQTPMISYHNTNKIRDCIANGENPTRNEKLPILDNQQIG